MGTDPSEITSAAAGIPLARGLTFPDEVPVTQNYTTTWWLDLADRPALAAQLAADREAYATGQIDLDEFERRAETILRRDRELEDGGETADGKSIDDVEPWVSRASAYYDLAAATKWGPTNDIQIFGDPFG